MHVVSKLRVSLQPNMHGSIAPIKSIKSYRELRLNNHVTYEAVSRNVQVRDHQPQVESFLFASNYN